MCIYLVIKASYSYCYCVATCSLGLGAAAAAAAKIVGAGCMGVEGDTPGFLVPKSGVSGVEGARHLVCVGVAEDRALELIDGSRRGSDRPSAVAGCSVLRRCAAWLRLLRSFSGLRTPGLHYRSLGRVR